MPFTALTSGTLVSSIGGELSLTNVSSPYIVVLGVQTASMQNGDIAELRAYTTILSGGPSVLAYLGTIAHAQGKPNHYSEPVMSDVEMHFTIKQTAGVVASYPWKLYILA